MEVSSLAVYEVSQNSSYAPLSRPSVIPDSEARNDLVMLPEEQPVDGAVAHKGGATPTASAESKAQFWNVFGSTFITIFLAELGDKTQVATLLMSAEFHAPWSVFTGAAIALITTSLLGVLVGQWLSSRISPKTLDTAAGIMLALLAVWLLWDAVTM